jgi:uncharacterized alkaline shock family protein YloU
VDAVADSLLDAPATRGRLVIRDRVIEQIARRSARDVEGVAPAQTGTWGSLTRQQSPRVDVTRAGDRIRVTVHVAVAWPEPLARVATEVRSAVTAQLTASTALTVERVDVRVDSTPDLIADSPRRRVQ